MANISLVNQNQASSNSTTSCSLTMTRCTVGNMLILAYAIRGNGNNPTLTDGWTKLGGGNNASDASDIHQDIYFAYKVATAETETVVVTQTTTGRIYMVCSEYTNTSRVVMRDDLSRIGNTNYTVTGSKSSANDVMIYAVTTTYYGSGRNQTTTPADLTKIEGDSSAERLACWFDDGSGALEHTFVADTGADSYDAVLECVQLLSAYRSSGSVEYGVQLGFEGTLSKSTISWEETVPENTSLSVMSKVSSGEYRVCQNGEEIPELNSARDLVGEILKIKIEMTTSDPSKTPTLSKLNVKLWNQEDDRVLVLRFGSGITNSIRNAVGPVTVGYAGGTLRGIGGPVPDFEFAFTPTGLVAKNHPHSQERVEVTNIEVKSTLTRIFYSDTKYDEHIDISPITVTANLIHVDDI